MAQRTQRGSSRALRNLHDLCG